MNWREHRTGIRMRGTSPIIRGISLTRNCLLLGSTVGLCLVALEGVSFTTCMEASTAAKESEKPIRGPIQLTL